MPALLITTDDFNHFSNLLFARIDSLENQVKSLRQSQLGEAYSLKQLAEKSGINEQALRRYTKLPVNDRSFLQAHKMKGGKKVYTADWEDFLSRTKSGAANREERKLRIA